MIPKSGSITLMIERLSHGEYSVVEALWRRFWERLKREASKKIGKRFLRCGDEEDVAQCVFHDVVQRIAENRVTGIRNRRRLWRLMEISTFHASVNMHRLEARTNPALHDSLDLPLEKPQQQPAVEFFVALEDDLEKLSDLIDENAKVIALMVLHGFDSSEIADQLDVTPRTIQRKLAAIRDAWVQINGNEWI